MFTNRSSQRVDLSTELGFAVVEGVARVFAAPSRVRSRVVGQATNVVDGVQGATSYCANRVVRLTGRGNT